MNSCFGFGRFAGLALLVALVMANTAAAQAPSDETIAFWIGEGLREDPRVAAADVNVSVNEGIVSLSGTVRNLAERNYSGLIAKKMQGVRGVVNQIDVFASGRGDDEIARDIRQRILHSSPIMAQPISVAVSKGGAVLSGTVQSYGQKAEAELVASEVHGVRAIQNKLDIRYPALRADSVILNDLLASLDRDVYLTGLPIEARVDAGMVTLRGTVGNAYQKERAALECWKTSNVTDVVNDLKVNWLQDRGERAAPAKPSDKELTDDVIAQLRHDQRVDAADVSVVAVSGHVTLRGSVPSFYQRQVAEQDARDVVGAVWVSNLLSVRAPIRPDSDILRDIQFEFAADYVLRKQVVQVRVVNGAAELSGTVSDYFTRSHASAVTGRVYGVRKVINNLNVGWSQKYRDNALAQRVRTRLAGNWETRWVASRITVDVQNGVVTLTGSVDQWSERREAERMAFLTDGVYSVENRLTVRGSQYQWSQWHSTRPERFPFDPFPEYRVYFFEVPLN